MGSCKPFFPFFILFSMHYHISKSEPRPQYGPMSNGYVPHGDIFLPEGMAKVFNKFLRGKSKFRDENAANVFTDKFVREKHVKDKIRASKKKKLISKILRNQTKKLDEFDRFIKFANKNTTFHPRTKINSNNEKITPQVINIVSPGISPEKSTIREPIPLTIQNGRLDPNLEPFSAEKSEITLSDAKSGPPLLLISPGIETSRFDTSMVDKVEENFEKIQDFMTKKEMPRPPSISPHEHFKKFGTENPVALSASQVQVVAAGENSLLPASDPYALVVPPGGKKNRPITPPGIAPPEAQKNRLIPPQNLAKNQSLEEYTKDQSVQPLPIAQNHIEVHNSGQNLPLLPLSGSNYETGQNRALGVSKLNQIQTQNSYHEETEKSESNSQTYENIENRVIESHKIEPRPYVVANDMGRAPPAPPAHKPLENISPVGLNVAEAYENSLFGTNSHNSHLRPVQVFGSKLYIPIDKTPIVQKQFQKFYSHSAHAHGIKTHTNLAHVHVEKVNYGAIQNLAGDQNLITNKAIPNVKETLNKNESILPKDTKNLIQTQNSSTNETIQAKDTKNSIQDQHPDKNKVFGVTLASNWIQAKNLDSNSHSMGGIDLARKMAFGEGSSQTSATWNEEDISKSDFLKTSNIENEENETENAKIIEDLEESMRLAEENATEVNQNTVNEVIEVKSVQNSSENHSFSNRAEKVSTQNANATYLHIASFLPHYATDSPRLVLSTLRERVLSTTQKPIEIVKKKPFEIQLSAQPFKPIIPSKMPQQIEPLPLQHLSIENELPSHVSSSLSSIQSKFSALNEAPQPTEPVQTHEKIPIEISPADEKVDLVLSQRGFESKSRLPLAQKTFQQTIGKIDEPKSHISAQTGYGKTRPPTEAIPLPLEPQLNTEIFNQESAQFSESQIQKTKSQLINQDTTLQRHQIQIEPAAAEPNLSIELNTSEQNLADNSNLPEPSNSLSPTESDLIIGKESPLSNDQLQLDDKIVSPSQVSIQPASSQIQRLQTSEQLVLDSSSLHLEHPTHLSEQFGVSQEVQTPIRHVPVNPNLQVSKNSQSHPEAPQIGVFQEVVPPRFQSQPFDGQPAIAEIRSSQLISSDSTIKFRYITKPPFAPIQVEPAEEPLRVKTRVQSGSEKMATLFLSVS